MNDRTRRRGAAVMGALAVLAAFAPVHAATAAPRSVDAPQRMGDVSIVDEDGGRLDHGGSATAFSLRLPDGAACPGDSQHDQWRIQSFIVPADVDPVTLTYDLIAPAGGGTRFALYDLQQNPYAQQLTQPNTTAGQPGRVGAVPLLSLGVFPPGTLPAGTYRVGVACTLFRATARVWDTTIVVSDDAGDRPARFQWRLDGTDPSVLDDGSSTGWLRPLLLAVGAVAAAYGLWLVRRTPKRRTPRSSQPEPEPLQEIS